MRAAKLEKNVKVPFKITHNRHHNVNIVTFSTGPAEAVMDLNITVVEMLLLSADEERSERLARHVRQSSSSYFDISSIGLENVWTLGLANLFEQGKHSV